MDYEKIESLLKEVKPIVEKSRRERAKRAAKGEFFNIFSILNVERDEVHTHSAMLPELLNPKGSHGQGDAFLKLFLKDVVHKEDLNTQAAEILTEFSIGSISEDETSGGRIDLAIQFADYLILIENKIDAGDQANQLLRYNNYAKETKKKYKLLYLSKDGHAPSEYSTGTEKENLYWDCISYSTHIKGWLKDYQNVANCPSNVKETIGQYIHLIDKLTGQENNSMEKELIDLMKANLEAAIAVSDNMQKLSEKLWEEFKEQVQNIATKKECSIADGYWDFWGNDTFLRFTPKAHADFHVCFGKVAGDSPFYWLEKDGVNKKQRKLNCMQADSGDDWPYGWTYIKNEYSAWNNTVLLAIKNGELKAYIAKCLATILDELEGNNWNI